MFSKKRNNLPPYIKNANEHIHLLKEKNDIVKSSFEKVCELCFLKIHTAVNLNSYTCLFEVPEFIMGYPLFNINECIIYIIGKLKDYGYKVNYFFPKLLHISWNAEETIQDKNNKKLLDFMNYTLKDKRFVPFLQMYMSKNNNNSSNPIKQIEHKNKEYETNTNLKQDKNESFQLNKNKGENQNIKNNKKKNMPKPVSQFKKNEKLVLDIT